MCRYIDILTCLCYNICQFRTLFLDLSIQTQGLPYQAESRDVMETTQNDRTAWDYTMCFALCIALSLLIVPLVVLGLYSLFIIATHSSPEQGRLIGDFVNQHWTKIGHVVVAMIAFLPAWFASEALNNYVVNRPVRKRIDQYTNDELIEELRQRGLPVTRDCTKARR